VTSPPSRTPWPSVRYGRFATSLQERGAGSYQGRIIAGEGSDSLSIRESERCDTVEEARNAR